jgi:flagellar hook-associated protein 2
MANWFDTIDVDTYVKGLISRESAQLDKVTQPQIKSLTDTQSSMKVQINTYNQLTSYLTDSSDPKSLYSVIDNLTKAFNPIYTVSSSATSAVTAQVSGTSLIPGTHTVNVTQMPQAGSYASMNLGFTSNTTVLGFDESLTVTDGTHPLTLPITATDTMQTVCDRLNVAATANGTGMTASLIQNSDGQYQLLVSSKNTGAANDIKITESGAGTANSLGIDNTIPVEVPPAVGGAKVLTAAADAKFTYDGIAFQQPGGTNVVAGISFTLVGLGSSTISVQGSDATSAVTTAAQAFVDTYNKAATYIAEAQMTGSSYDPNLTLIFSTLQNTLNAGFAGNGAIFNTLNDLGIVPMLPREIPAQTVTVSLQQDGSSSITSPVVYHPKGLLKINADATQGKTFASALSSNFAAVQATLVGAQGILANLQTMFNNTPVQNTSIGTVTGEIKNVQDMLKKKSDDLTAQITDQRASLDALKKDLPRKYASLDVTLLRLQLYSKMLSSQFSSGSSS